MKDRSELTTEKRNARSANIDCCSTLQIVDIINAEDRKVAPAVTKERVHIAAAVDAIVESLGHGGRLFYVGAGTSGRLGVLDASECPPTFGTPPTQVQGIIAGGWRALVRSIEGAEDSISEGALALNKKRVTSRDVVVGIAACGITPFVHGALAHASQVGASTIFVTCAPEAKAYVKSDIIITPVVGPEVVTGSTRMKAGTATKLVLNTLTTAAMIKLGKVYGNLMVDLKASNNKLRDRAERIVIEVTGVSRSRARSLLAQARNSTKTAILMHLGELSCGSANELLKQFEGSLRKAVDNARTHTGSE